MYGLTIDSVEAVAREGLACVVHLELEVSHYTVHNVALYRLQCSIISAPITIYDFK